MHLLFITRGRDFMSTHIDVFNSRKRTSKQFINFIPLFPELVARDSEEVALLFGAGRILFF